ncbi:hypothetical protein [Bacillus sp. H1a]|uniref:hypothetical protein n=1 Tax=Bacillus sp. H1a TaxID=1397276 RepID=UPI0004695BE7|nr:hypothetical protein [Bacillus sp. H1a]
MSKNQVEIVIDEQGRIIVSGSLADTLKQQLQMEIGDRIIHEGEVQRSGGHGGGGGSGTGHNVALICIGSHNSGLICIGDQAE